MATPTPSRLLYNKRLNLFERLKGLGAAELSNHRKAKADDCYTPDSKAYRGMYAL